MKLNLDYVEGKWFKYKGDAEVKIKMLSFSKAFGINLRRNPDKIDGVIDETTLEELYFVYDECLEDWKGFETPDGKELKCNPKNKKLYFEASREFSEFVIEKQQELRDSFETSLKN